MTWSRKLGMIMWRGLRVWIIAEVNYAIRQNKITKNWLGDNCIFLLLDREDRMH